MANAQPARCLTSAGQAGVHLDIQKDGQTDRRTYRQTDGQSEEETKRQRGGNTEEKAEIRAERQTDR